MLAAAAKVATSNDQTVTRTENTAGDCRFENARERR